MGELLLESGRIKKEQLEKALQDQQRSAEPLGKVLVRLGYVQEKDVLQALQGLLVVTFHIRDEVFAFEALFVREIIRFAPLNHLPRMPRYVMGLLHHRELVVPVINLAARFGWEPRAEDDDTRIILVEVASQFYGLVADGVEAVVQLSMDQIESTPAAMQGIDSRFIGGVARHDQLLITLLQLEKILETVTPDLKPAEGGEPR